MPFLQWKITVPKCEHQPRCHAQLLVVSAELLKSQDSSILSSSSGSFHKFPCAIISFSQKNLRYV